MIALTLTCYFPFHVGVEERFRRWLIDLDVAADCHHHHKTLGAWLIAEARRNGAVAMESERFSLTARW